MLIKRAAALTSRWARSFTGSTVRCCQDGHNTPSPLEGGVVDVKDFIARQQLSTITHPRPSRGSGVGELLAYNKNWSQKVQRVNPQFFSELAKQQTPQYLWIGCADSRVPANQVVGLSPGEVFVHRNVANVVSRSDLNCLSCLQFAVEILKVEHVIVCGHYGCGGVHAALDNRRVGLADNWIMHVADVKKQHLERLMAVPEENRLNLLCELNVIAQMSHVVESHIMRDWWASSTAHRVDVHGWIYGLQDGRVTPLLSVSRDSSVETEVANATEAAFRRYSRA